MFESISDKGGIQKPEKRGQEDYKTGMLITKIINNIKKVTNKRFVIVGL